jgi:hypothetical protein
MYTATLGLDLLQPRSYRARLYQTEESAHPEHQRTDSRSADGAHGTEERTALL